MNYWHKILLRHRVYCEKCAAPIPATRVGKVGFRDMVLCDAHWRAYRPIEEDLKQRSEELR